MPKFNITATFSLTSEVEPDLYLNAFDPSDAEDYKDLSYWSTAPVTSDGGSLSFTVEAEDEEDAERKAEEIIDTGTEITDRNNLTWLVDDVNVEVEEVEEEMTKSRAVALIEAYLIMLSDAGKLDAVLREAFEFLLREVTA